MLDLTKPVYTRSGKRVYNLTVVIHNSAGREVTFPLKGSIDRGPHRDPDYNIWTLDGKFGVIPEHENHPLDLFNRE